MTTLTIRERNTFFALRGAVVIVDAREGATPELEDLAFLSDLGLAELKTVVATVEDVEVRFETYVMTEKGFRLYDEIASVFERDH